MIDIVCAVKLYCTHNTLGPAARTFILLQLIMGYIVYGTRYNGAYTYAPTLEEAEQKMSRTSELVVRSSNSVNKKKIISWKDYEQILQEPDNPDLQKQFKIVQFHRGL